MERHGDRDEAGCASWWETALIFSLLFLCTCEIIAYVLIQSELLMGT